MATVQNIANTQTDISGHIYTNGNRLITAADVASVLQNMAVSYINRITDLPYLGLKAFSTTTTYAVGDCCVYLGVLYQCTTTHTGAWNGADFTAIGGAAISSLNGLTASTQTFSVGTIGTNFAISSSGATHTFNLPTASATNRGALSSADWSTFNSKQPALSGTGFVKISGTTISYDNSTYLTGNQTITLSGAVTGSGATTITTTLANNIVGIANLSATGTPSSSTYLRGDNTWATITAMTNPMTTQGDTIYGGASGTPTRLALGTSGYILQAGAASPSWFNLFGTANSFSVNQNFTVTPATGGDLTSIAATFGSITGSGTIRVGQYAYLTTQLTGSFQGVGLTSTDSTGTIWFSNGSVGGNNVTINLGGSTGTGAATGGIINGIKGLTTFNGISTFDNIATNAGNSMKFRSKNTSSTQLDRLVIDGWATTAPINMINSVVNIGGTSIITANSTLQISGSLALANVAKTANYTLTSSDCVVFFNGASLTATLPSAASVSSRMYVIANRNATALTISAYLNFAGTSTTTIATMTSIIIISDGTNWQQIQ
jgi:hypothetical protein